MTFRQRLTQQPQSLWARKALFQVHLWTGIGVGIYMLAISLSGSAIVFRRELAKLLAPTTYVTPTDRRMTDEELTAIVKKANPRFDVIKVLPSKKPNAAVEVWMSRGDRVDMAGADTTSVPGPPPPCSIRMALCTRSSIGSVRRRPTSSASTNA